jgi:hypothetical protein
MLRQTFKIMLSKSLALINLVAMHKKICVLSQDLGELYGVVPRDEAK